MLLTVQYTYKTGWYLLMYDGGIYTNKYDRLYCYIHILV